MFKLIFVSHVTFMSHLCCFLSYILGTLFVLTSLCMGTQCFMPTGFDRQGDGSHQQVSPLSVGIGALHLSRSCGLNLVQFWVHMGMAGPYPDLMMFMYFFRDLQIVVMYIDIVWPCQPMSCCADVHDGLVSHTNQGSLYV